MVVYTRHKHKANTMCWYLLWGIACGALLGYIVMGSTRAVFEVQRRSPIEQGKKGSVQRSKKISDGDSVHTLCTTNGSPYQNYQMRIAYATYKLMQKMPGGEKHVAFTRILHRTDRDVDPLKEEIPTFRADPLQPQCDDWCEYPVSDRGNAVNQYLEAARQDPSMIQGKWLYMVESDYVFMKPLEVPTGSDASSKAWGYPFTYINPPAYPHLMKRLCTECDPNKIPHTGPAPILMTLDLWEKVTPVWEEMAAMIEADDEIKKSLGWVREMYGFSVALSKTGINIDLAKKSDTRFIAELPIDSALGHAHAYHYTQCTIFKTVEGEDVWGYDKRFFTEPKHALNVPKVDPIPPFQDGKWKFIEGKMVTKQMYDSIVDMIGQMNNGIETLPDLSAA